MSNRDFLGELRRRNVIRMAGLYFGGAWLIVQVAETLLPRYDTPGWVLMSLLSIALSQYDNVIDKK